MNPQKTVAVIGASNDRSKYGNKSLRAHIDQGYTVYPVNPREETVEGLQSYPTVADIPVDQLDRITVYVPPRVGLGLLEQYAAKHPAEVWFNPGTESDELMAKAEELGLPAIYACSIIDLGTSPARYPNQ